ncbi:MAG: molybdopterin-binding protein [Aestuariivita sp.]|nr:molybdopterin-binding protein [Aestuariivita sp.]
MEPDKPTSFSVVNDCFALPPGVDWTAVDEALATIRSYLVPIVGVEKQGLAQALGRVLAEPVMALRSNPPCANSAVDGYGFWGPVGDGPKSMLLVGGRAAAGKPFQDTVPPGQAIRILTGASLPHGVDTVVLDEQVQKLGSIITFDGPIKRYTNTRKAGEDVVAGRIVIKSGRCLTAADVGLATAVGVSEVTLRKRLRVAIVSTGNELVETGLPVNFDQIYDVNRPMLKALVSRFGFEVIDIGKVSDNRSDLRQALDLASKTADLILVSGGASAGDEDHVSALLHESGALKEWRIAVKPGRPLAFGLWNTKPIFGLPGNPVAAFVCSLIFVWPAMNLRAGRGWTVPSAFNVPSGFSKSKKAGRREYLRARMRDGKVDVFESEGSGRVSGLSWAEGLVELCENAQTIHVGDTVRFIPYSSFGL